MSFRETRTRFSVMPKLVCGFTPCLYTITKLVRGTIKYYTDFRRDIPDSWVRTYVFLPRLPCHTFQLSLIDSEIRFRSCADALLRNFKFRSRFCASDFEAKAS